MSMITEVIEKKRSGKRIFGRGALLWMGSLAVGTLCFAATWAYRTTQINRESSALMAVQGVVYDQGATTFARQSMDRFRGIGPVAVVAIKEGTLKDLSDAAAVPSFVPGIQGNLSFQNPDHKRAFHARLLQNLTQLGAKVVVFDIVFDREIPTIDDYFAAAIKAHGKVVLAASEDRSTEVGGQAESAALILPNATLRANAAGIGVVNVDLDRDKSLRRFLWYFKGIDEDTAEDTFYPTLGVAAAAAAGGADPKKVIQAEVQPQQKFLGKPIVWEKRGANHTSNFRFYGESGFVSGQGSVINYESLLRRGQEAAILNRLREQVQGKIVIIGDETLLGQDYHRVPIFSKAPGGGTTQQMPGVEIQGHITQSVLNGTYVREAPTILVLLLTLVTCLLVAIVGRILQTGPMVLITGVVLIGLYMLSTMLHAGAGVFLEPVTATGGAVVTMIAETGLMYFAERRQRQAVRRQLSRHVGAGVAEKLDQDEWPEMSGESREITMLFSDLQGFTSISESLTSPEICSLLNRYFGVIFPIVDRHFGTLDKLMGDGMMVYFGWPKRTPDHAEKSIRCAIEMQEALDAWQRQPENAGMPQLRTRIGLHTGTATIGEVGSGDRVEFTVIGDVVNVASRLEGMNKDFGTTILLSESTRNAAGEVVPMAYRGVASVRGRKEPMPVYSVETGGATGRQRTTGRSASMRVDATGTHTELQG